MNKINSVTMGRVLYCADDLLFETTLYR